MASSPANMTPTTSPGRLKSGDPDMLGVAIPSTSNMSQENTGLQADLEVRLSYKIQHFSHCWELQAQIEWGFTGPISTAPFYNQDTNLTSQDNVGDEVNQDTNSSGTEMRNNVVFAKNTGTAFYIGDRKAVTNAHLSCEEFEVLIKERGIEKKWIQASLYEMFENDIPFRMTLLAVNETRGFKLCLKSGIFFAVRTFKKIENAKALRIFNVPDWPKYHCDMLEVEGTSMPGMFGSPLFNLHGDVVGVIFARLEAIGRDSGSPCALAVPSLCIHELLDWSSKNPDK
ncbi:hypothetical protein Vadar_033657 [Vaccinium darrowii]|uniref:Uncharacterized protein n=1 Tax=Vaccinium darrowii TaxID=229202 RepID=A0ACB7X6B9_9ERIC|nr:hypothetical protein Vadar_033657 [Vaccinium darrowii]